MSSKIFAQPSQPGPVPTQALARPINILKIESALASLAEEKADVGVRLRNILTYLLKLTNGQGITWHDYPRGTAHCREAIWLNEEDTHQGILLLELSTGANQVIGAQKAVIQTLTSVEKHFSISVPLLHAGRIRGCIGLVLIARDIKELQPFVVILQTALGFLHYTLLHEEIREGMLAIQQTSALVELTSLAASASFSDESLRILVDEIQEHLKCHAVALGMTHRKKIRLSALSGSTRFDKRGSTAYALQSAMRETVLHDAPIHWPRRPEETDRPDLSDVAHQELQRVLDLAHSASYPLKRGDGKTIAVLTILWRHDQLPTPVTYRFLDSAAPHLGAHIHKFRQADPASIRKWHHYLWGRISRRKRTFFAVAGLLLVGILCWPIHFPVRVDCQIQPVLRRVVSSPFDGILKKAFAEPGQNVRQGDLLALLDDRELLWKHAELLAARDRAIRQRDLAMTDNDSPVAVTQMAQFEVESLELEIRLVEYRQDNLELRAPLDGIILTGDLQRAEGIPLRQGQVLYEVGPDENMIVELLIPSHDIALVKPGAEVRMRLASFPGVTWNTTIRTIRPQSEIIDSRNVFVAEAEIHNEADSTTLRAGMKGRAGISGERAPIGWVLTRRLWDFIHLHLIW